MVTHGGDAGATGARYGIASNELVDFSANIDAYGPPAAVREVLSRYASQPQLLRSYPSRSAYERTCASIAGEVGVDPESIVLGPGSASLLDAVIRFADAQSIIVPVPAFSEYARAAAAAGKELIEYALPPSFELDPRPFVQRGTATRSAALVNTPHNPSGRALSKSDVLRIIAGTDDTGLPAIVDEAFVDYVPERSIVGEVQHSAHALVIRSLTKFYALAGVRIGYAVLRPDRARRLRTFIPSWPTGSLELEIACAAVADLDYARNTRERNKRERESLAAALQALDILVYSSVANFLLLELPCAAQEVDSVLERLVREHGIVVRDCRDYRGLEQRAAIRVAVLGQDDNRRLAAALRAVLYRERSSTANVRPGIG